jgi:hypothetical protein
VRVKPVPPFFGKIMERREGRERRTGIKIME